MRSEAAHRTPPASLGQAGPIETGNFAELRQAASSLMSAQAKPPEGPFYVYGAGGFGQRIARELVRLGRPVIGLIDRRAAELGSVAGLPCFHPDQVGPSAAGRATYVHGLMNHLAPSHEVAEWAAGRGFRRLIFPTGLLALPGFALENYWLARGMDLAADLDHIEDLHDRLEDEESRTLLRALVLYRLSSDPRHHPAVAVAEAYRPDFLPIFDRPITFVDGGAYTGDTVEALLASGARMAEWIAFEPDARNMAQLRQTAQRHRGALPAATLMQAGLAATTGTVRFLDGAGEASRVLAEGEAAAGATEIPVLRFDDVFSRSGPVYVKLDIEGAELDALAGMSALLAERPILAVSLYHRPADLWEIPEAIARVYDRPRFRLRQHGHHGFDSVLYVMPG